MDERGEEQRRNSRRGGKFSSKAILPAISRRGYQREPLSLRETRRPKELGRSTAFVEGMGWRVLCVGLKFVPAEGG